MFSRRDMFDPPSRSEQILSSPLGFIISTIYGVTSRLRSTPVASKSGIRVVCISDTHTQTCNIPDGDLLIHAGDLTNKGTVEELQAQINWLESLPHKHKVAIAGNHDTYLDPRSRATLDDDDDDDAADDESNKLVILDWGKVHYLQHRAITFDFPLHGNRRLKIYGAPQIPQCGGEEFAFQYPRGQDAWTDTLPTDIDVLVTHTPPKYHRDLCLPWLGCEWLLKEVWRVKPKLHVFGHVHAGAGKEVLWWDQAQSSYEMACKRASKGAFKQLFNVRLWIDGVKVFLHGLGGVMWDRVWGGEQRRTILVNAALMYNNTGVLKNRVQVVDI